VREVPLSRRITRDRKALMSTSDGPIRFEVDSGVARVTINRPDKRNSLTVESVVRLARAWRAIEEDPSVRVAILTGAGDKAFCSGADLGTLIPLITDRREPQDEWDREFKENPRIFNQALLRTHTFTVPVIAAVRGFALAGGSELAMGADIIVAAEDAVFGLPEVARGLVPGGGGIARLSRGVPYAFAAEVVLTGDHISAGDAHRMGIVNRVVPSAEVLPSAEAIARRMARNAPIAMRKAKEGLIRCRGVSLGEAFHVENELVAAIAKTEDAHEGPRAFMEKRAPNFVGR
jgi:enoyl-CoA hydratase